MLEIIESQIYKHYLIMKAEIGESAHLFIYPLIGLLPLALFANVMIENGAPPETMSFLIIGTIVWNFYAVAQRGVTYGLVWEFWARTVRSLFASRISIGEFIIGNVIVGLITGLIAGAFALAVAYFWFSFNLFSLGLWLIPAFLMVVLNASSEGLILNSLIILMGPKFRALIWIIPGVIMIFCGIYYPVSALPLSARAISYMLPTTYAVKGLRDAYAGFPNINDFIIGASISIVYMLISSYIFKLSIKKAKRNGLLVRLDE